MKNMNHKFVAIITTGVILTDSYSALAGGENLESITTNVKKSAAGIPDLIATVAYIAGIGLGVAGIFKLKEHVDNPGQTDLKSGLIRLASGGGLLTLPYITDAMMHSVGSKGGDKVKLTDVSFGSDGFK